MGRVTTWLAGTDTGVSSKTMAFWLQWGTRYGHASTPSDPADLGRCLRMLRACPHLKSRVPKMADMGGLWPTFARRWDEMARSMEAEVGIDWEKARRAPETYDLMHRVETEAYREAGYDVVVGADGHWRSVSRPDPRLTAPEDRVA